MTDDLKTRVEKVIDRTCYVVNGENVSNLVKDLYAALESEIAGFKLIAMQRDAFATDNQRLEQENAALREVMLKVKRLALEGFHDAQDAGSVYRSDFGERW